MFLTKTLNVFLHKYSCFCINIQFSYAFLHIYAKQRFYFPGSEILTSHENRAFPNHDDRKKKKRMFLLSFRLSAAHGGISEARGEFFSITEHTEATESARNVRKYLSNLGKLGWDSPVLKAALFNVSSM